MYVDGFVLLVPKKNLEAYKKLAKVASKVWREHGALDYKECIGDDLKVDFGRSFTQLAKPKPSELVVFAYVLYKSKAHRNAVNKKVMKDERLECQPNKMPFDIAKMSCGGFKVIVG